ncbi:secondary thiamine-phosphate synthase enzyme [Roseivivax halodurans JCM 10272]|uniref:Secondary thiamine-phosphate synthase enzyme n=1 Tax=Roseivivax halodurans JCM 10272 TaxID=1449350 RepID=X7EE97_9RHOB|nr:secondary thiamine-phosphate synthase enzyme YjbQ [Roseivivax halodurans]ETX14210.1 secondary thiamine-phosphate synthase enzyme [Roseivivax halodurans JCM 10272]
MTPQQTTFQIQTRGPGLYEMTRDVSAWAGPTGTTGLLTLFVRHTSASLLIQENADPDVRHDLDAFFSRLVPRADEPAMSYLTHTIEGPDDMPAHIRAALLPVSLSIPVENGALSLGTWQGIYLFEHRDAPHRRNVVAHLSA